MTHHEEKDDYVSEESTSETETHKPGGYTGAQHTEGNDDFVFPVDHGAGEENESETDAAEEEGTGYVTSTDHGDGS